MPTSFPTTIDSFVNPTASDKLNGNPNPATIHHVQHTNINDAVSALEEKVGIDFSNVNTSIDYAIQVLCATTGEHPRGVRKRLVGQPFPTSITWYADSGETIKLVDKILTYGPGSKKFVTSVVYRFYDGTAGNLVKRTITDTITLSGAFPVVRDRTIT